jgi:cobalt-zinc-cadmium efflux system membrane fusion protein
MAQARVVFISPALDRDTRSARVVATLPNPAGVWRPGSFITAAIAIEEHATANTVPVAALQTVNGETAVFVRTKDGFEKRTVGIGRRDSRLAEIVSGLQPGEPIAVSNTFALKAEALKDLAED